MPSDQCTGKYCMRFYSCDLGADRPTVLAVFAVSWVCGSRSYRNVSGGQPARVSRGVSRAANCGRSGAMRRRTATAGFILLDFSLRPGQGLALGDWRVTQTWKLLQCKRLHPTPGYLAADCRGAEFRPQHSRISLTATSGVQILPALAGISRGRPPCRPVSRRPDAEFNQTSPSAPRASRIFRQAPVRLAHCWHL